MTITKLLLPRSVTKPLYQSGKEILKPIAWYIYSMIHGHWVFYKQIYGTVFLSIVSFFRILSPGKALADYFYLDRVFIAVLMISVAAEARKSPRHLWVTFWIQEKSKAHAGRGDALLTPSRTPSVEESVFRDGKATSDQAVSHPSTKHSVHRLSRLTLSHPKGSVNQLFLQCKLHPPPLLWCGVFCREGVGQRDKMRRAGR